MQKVFMMEPEGAKAKGDRAKVLIMGQLKKDGFMIRGVVRKDFGRS